jgi:hypothetical protein
VPSAGIRAEADGIALAYSGDTGPGLALAELGRDADIGATVTTLALRCQWGSVTCLRPSWRGRTGLSRATLVVNWPSNSTGLVQYCRLRSCRIAKRTF